MGVSNGGDITIRSGGTLSINGGFSPPTPLGVLMQADSPTNYIPMIETSGTQLQDVNTSSFFNLAGWENAAPNAPGQANYYEKTMNTRPSWSPDAVGQNMTATGGTVSGTFSFEGWIYPTSGGPAWIVTDNNESTQTNWGLFINADESVSWFVSPFSGGADLTTGASVINLNQWNHVASVQDSVAPSRTLYINGVAEASDAVIPTFTGAANVRITYLGSNRSDSNFFLGRMHHWAMYLGQVLTLPQIADRIVSHGPLE